MKGAFGLIPCMNEFENRRRFEYYWYNARYTTSQILNLYHLLFYLQKIPYCVMYASVFQIFKIFPISPKKTMNNIL